MSLPNKEKWEFRLYIAGDAPNSRMAMANLAEIRQAYRLEDCELEIVDILKDPLRAIRDGILVTPTLLKLCPGLPCRIIGNLSDRKKVLQALGLSGGAE